MCLIKFKHGREDEKSEPPRRITIRQINPTPPVVPTPPRSAISYRPSPHTSTAAVVVIPRSELSRHSSRHSQSRRSSKHSHHSPRTTTALVIVDPPKDVEYVRPSPYPRHGSGPGSSGSIPRIVHAEPSTPSDYQSRARGVSPRGSVISYHSTALSRTHSHASRHSHSHSHSAYSPSPKHSPRGSVTYITRTVSQRSDRPRSGSGQFLTPTTTREGEVVDVVDADEYGLHGPQRSRSVTYGVGVKDGTGTPRRVRERVVVVDGEGRRREVFRTLGSI